jgi:nucleotide-binding universal stress UspA family protein
MYSKILIPLDGSKTAEKVLPYARALAENLKARVELIGALNVAEMAAHISAEHARHLDTITEEGERRSLEYLKKIATTFPGGGVACTVEKGRPEDVILEKAAIDAGTLIAMATHGRSGLDRWLLGSIAEKVLRGATTPLLLIRASEQTKSEGEAPLKAVIVPLDGSELAESVLPAAVELAKKLNLEIVLFRAYNIPYSAYGGGDGYYAIDFTELTDAMKDEAQTYLEKKRAELKTQGFEKISCLAREGLSADQIIKIGRETPASLIAMCSHGRSGAKRWVLGSVTETVVRHGGDPVLVIRAV